MEPQLFEPYRRGGGWDWKAIMLASALVRGNAWAVVVVIAAGLFCVAYFFLQITIDYLWAVYRKRAFSGTYASGILLLALCGFVMGVPASLIGYSEELITLYQHINILAFSFLLFVLIVVGVDIYEERREARQSQAAALSSNAQDYMTWKTKGSNNKP